MIATYRTVASGGASSGTGNRTAAITPAVGDLLLVFGNFTSNTNASATCADNNNSGTYTKVTGALYNSSADYLNIFVRDTPMLNTTSTTITVTTGSNASGNIIVVAVSGMGHFGNSAIRQFAILGNQTATATPTVSFSLATLSYNMTLGVVGNANNAANMTAPTNWTERSEVAQSSNSACLEVVTRDSGFAGTQIAWGNASAYAYAVAILELNGYDARSGFSMHNNPAIF